MLPRRIPHVALVLLLSLGAGSCTAPNQISGDTLFSDAVKLSVTKPPGWRFVSPQEIRAAQRSPSSTNRHLNYVIYQSAAAPAVLMMKNSDEPDAPYAAVSIYRYPLNEDRFASAVKVAGFIIGDHQFILSRVQVMVPPMNLQAGKDNFTFCRIKYPISLTDGTTREVEKQFWIWSFPFSATIVSATCESRHRIELQPEIERIVRSIQFKP